MTGSGGAQEQRSVAPDGRPEVCQPAWRREFPVDTDRDNDVARRDFTRFLVLTSFAFVVGQLWIAVLSWFRRRAELPSLPIARVDEVPVGGAKAFHYPEAHDPCVLLRPDTETFLAYNQQCTHLCCAVVPKLDKGCLECPCHKGSFDVQTGRPIAGPPRRPLSRIQLEVREGVVHATGVERRTV